MQPADQLSATFAALADPTRRAILSRLAAGEASVKDLSEPFAMSQPAISKHLRVLERAGLIERGRRAQWRPRRLRAMPLLEVAEWIGQYRPHWESDSSDSTPSSATTRIQRTDRKGSSDDRDQD